ncbi:MAG: CHAT domain-containing protein [Acidobacteria bacterium]|nr:CHAT domain-containing protein [Acidobacteriota bacterium]
MTTRQRLLFETILPGAALALLAVYALSCRADEEPQPEPASEKQEESVVLERGRPVEREIVPGEVHRYSLDLESNDFVQVVVDQRGIDVVTTLFDPDGESIASIDRRIGDYGPEPLLALAEQPGTYRLEVRAFGCDEPPGNYEVKVVELRQASATDRIRARAAGVFARGEELRRQRDYDSAARSYQDALQLWREIDDRFWQAETLDRLGFVNAALGQWEDALRSHQESARFFAIVGDSRSESLALNWQASARFYLGQVQEALNDFQRALELRPDSDDNERAILLINLAQTYQALGEIAEASEHYDQARRLLADGGDSAAKAQILHQLGFLYRTLGEAARALDYLNEAEAMWSRLGNRNSRAASIHQRGRLFLELGKPSEALRNLRQALELRRETRHLRGQVAALTSLGEVLQRLGDRESALERFQEALEIARSERLQSPAAEARVLQNLGSLSGPADTRAFYEASRGLYRQVEDATGEAEALFGIARAERREGNLTDALRSVEAALDLAESLRPKSFSDDLSHSFFATVQPYFEFYIDLLMDLHRSNPASAYDARALAAAERARARALLDLLSEAGADVRSAADPGLIERERALQRKINIAERWRLRLFDDRRRTEEERAAAAKAVRQLLDELGRLRAEIRHKSPRYAALTQPQTLELDEIQRSVLDEETLLLEYWLGAERSFLYVVSPDSLSSFELPSRGELEPKVRRAYKLLTRSHRPESRRAVQNALCDLSKILLQPASAHLKDKRLVIVPDGALQYLPFSALADPRDLGKCPAARPLLLTNETTYLPSASVLAVLRKETAGRPKPKGMVAVLADPVFSRQDERVASASPDTDSILPAGDLAEDRNEGNRSGELGAFHRLRLSRREAKAILALAPEGSSFQALDFEASKRLVLSGDLADYRILHFATHAVLDSTRPGLSGIVFSMVDRNGTDQDGFLRAHELYNLRLPADLVVLSACRTALGKEVRGEGLVGLTRAFAYACAQRLMVGLWNVQDRSTAELMERFYRRLFAEDSRPSAALRAAQISLWKERPAPYYWAGFVMQGEYK